MLLFIFDIPDKFAIIYLFQYISCYSLSFAAIVNIKPFLSFNTSHVTLYRLYDSYYVRLDEFQYISCYSLSFYFTYRKEKFQVSIHLMLLFIVNRKPLIFSQIHVSIHLMLLFIRIRLDNCVFTERFNTSHVTLYPKENGLSCVCQWFQYISCYSLSNQIMAAFLKTGVSIHLMLLFIEQAQSEVESTFSFQYISCYSLSLVL